MPATELDVDVERRPGSTVELRVTAPPQEVEAAVSASLRRYAARMRFPGFRPGKAPAAIVERSVGWEAVRQDTLEHLVADLYGRAVAQAGLEPVADPQVNVDGTLERAQPLSFTATVTVKPEVDLRDYHAIRVPRQTTEVGEEMVDEAIEAVRRGHATLRQVDRPAQAGDVLRCSLVMRRGEEVLSGESSAERDLELDRASVISDIVDGIIGLRGGERRSFDVTLPQDYQREELRGATVTFDVDVVAVRERELPPLDDSLAGLDGHGETLEELRRHHREQLQQRALETDQERFEQNVLAALRDHVRVDVPQVMVDREVERQLADLELRLGALGVPFESWLQLSGQSLEKVRAERREPAVQRVRLELALDALAAAEGLEVDEDQVQREAQRIAEGRRLDASQRRRLEDIARRDLTRRAASERLLEIVEGDGFVQT